MEEEKRRLIQSYIEGTDQTGIHSDSIGLKNVIDRMKAFFKDGFASGNYIHTGRGNGDQNKDPV